MGLVAVVGRALAGGLLNLAEFSVPGALITITLWIATHVWQVGRIQIGLKTDLAVLAFKFHDIKSILWIFYVEALAGANGAGHGASSPYGEKFGRKIIAHP
jgi:hypothetical protein